MKKVIFAIAVIAAAGLSTFKAAQTNDYQLSDMTMDKVEMLAQGEPPMTTINYCQFIYEVGRCVLWDSLNSACPNYACGIYPKE